MRVGIIAPNYHRDKSGNSVTVRRIARNLQLLGCEVQVFPVEELAGEALLSKVQAFAPRLLHAFHGYLGGRMARAVAQAMSIPYLITLTGTDIYQTLCDQRRHDTQLALKDAVRLVAFHTAVKRRLADHCPSLEERTVVIPQGVELPAEAATRQEADGFTFLLPAGLRPVKNVLFPLSPLASLYPQYPRLCYQLVGPVRDTEYAAKVLDALEEQRFARYLGEVPHDSMGTIYRGADVVLNCSDFEGGMANSVLEGMAYGKPVLASDIDGNRSVVKEGVTGLLYRNDAEFRSKAMLLLEDAQLRERLGRNARAMMREKHSPEKEAEAYFALYHSLLS
ncbi:MAG TPA: GPMC system family 4 glycosyltransferase [Geomonas sp.]|nr:GPMC system family 4 glycosyltransferase [Geomonas sp.]